MKKIIKQKIVHLCILSLTIYSCKNENVINDYFQKLEVKLTADERVFLSNCDDMDCIESFLFTHPNSEFLKSLKNLPKSVIDSMNSYGLQKTNTEHLLLAFCQHSKGNSYSFNEIINEVNIYYQLQDSIKNTTAKEARKLEEQLAIDNFKNIDNGDTICLALPIESQKNGYIAHFGGLEDWDDVTYITFIILKKQIIRYNDVLVKPEFNLDMEVIDFSHRPCKFLNEDLKRGLKMKVNLIFYSRVLERCG